MAPPSSLAIATSALSRLCKEEASYHAELEQQVAQADALETKLHGRNGDAGHDGGEGDGDGNEEFMLKQQKTAIEQTKAVFAPLQTRIAEARTKLEEQIEASQAAGDADAGELEQAKAVLAKAKTT